MQSAELSATLQTAFVYLDFQATHSDSVLFLNFQRVVLWKGQHLACHPLVVQTQSVENKMELAHVLASQITWVTHMRLVVQNVF